LRQPTRDNRIAIVTTTFANDIGIKQGGTV